MLEVYRARGARGDVVEIWRYVALNSNSFAVADRLADRFEATFRMLAEQPLAGRLRPELAEDIRSFPVGSYVIFYRARPSRIDVIRVLSAYRDLGEAVFDPRE